MDLISIVVPIYNVEKYLDRCIYSIINQTYKNLEIILVNDGSTDSCIDICNKYKKIDSRISVVDKKNGGLSSARNAGIDIATGKYIMFIDSDDYIDSNMVEVMYNDILSKNADVSICNFYLSYDNYDFKNNAVLNITISDDSKYQYLYGKYSIQTIISWNKLYKRELFMDIRFPDGLLHEDQYIICDILNKCNIISYNTDKFLYHYVQRNNSIMKTFNFKRFDVVIALNRRIAFFESIGNDYLGDRTKLEKVQLLHELFNECSNIELNDTQKEVYEKYYQEYFNTFKELKSSKLKFFSKLKLLLLVYLPKLYDFLKRGVNR